MRVSSIKILWLTSLLSVAHAQAAVDPSFKIRLEGKLAGHIFSPTDLARHRYTLELEQKLNGKYWSLVGGARGYAEGAFASNARRYGTQVREKESEEIALRDLYVQYKDQGFVFRVGNQQVAWGEAFGFYFADVVNPKDFRDFFLGDLAAQRVPVPMVDLKFLFGKWSLEGVYLPRPTFDIASHQGGDFAFPFDKMVPGATITVNETRSLPIALKNSEVGARVGLLLGEMDLSLYYFNHFDRQAAYQMTILNPAPLSVEINEIHPRVQSFGFTATHPLSDLVLRAETVYTTGRRFNAISAALLSDHASDEWVWVVGADYSRGDWRYGLQFSQRNIMERLPTFILPRNREMISLHIQGTVIKEQGVDLILSYAPRDGSSLVQAKYQVPFSSQFDGVLGADLLLGGSSSQFGQYKPASRAYIALRGFFNG